MHKLLNHGPMQIKIVVNRDESVSLVPVTKREKTRTKIYSELLNKNSLKKYISGILK